MPRKYETITELYYRTQAEAATPQNWQRFLTTACRNYKLPFDEQLLLFAQRPEATAVLEIDRWNRLFGRWVNRGATGIAVLDRTAVGRARLKYYFDISDTHPGRWARPVPLWEMRPAYEAETVEALEHSFGPLSDRTDFPAALRSAAQNAVEDNQFDYLLQLLYYKEDSFLEELERENIEVLFRNLMTNSVGYMLLARCGLDPVAFYEDEDFREIVNFNTPNTLNTLGTATGDIAQMCLSEIARTVQDLQRQPKSANRTVAPQEQSVYPEAEPEDHQRERSTNHETDHLPNGTGLPPAQPPAAPGAGDHPWEVRIAPQELSGTAPAGDVHEPAHQRDAERPSLGGRGDGPAAEGGAGDGAGPAAGRDGGDEGRRPDEVGGPDEQHPQRSGGDSAERADLRLNDAQPEPLEEAAESQSDSADESAGGSQLPALLDEGLVTAMLAHAGERLQYNRSQVELYFSVHPDPVERGDYLRSALPEGPVALNVQGVDVGYRPQEDGLLLWEGSEQNPERETLLSWAAVAEITGQLLKDGTFRINTAVQTVKPQELQQLTMFDAAPPEPENDEQAVPATGIQYPQQVIDEALCLGANDAESRIAICAFFCKDKPTEENARFLQEHYGENGAGFVLDGRQYALWYNADGLRISAGDSAQTPVSVLLTWEQAAERIRVLLELGRYLPRQELEQVEAWEYKSAATALIYLWQDATQEAKEGGYLPTVSEAYEPGGFPEKIDRMTDRLRRPEGLRQVTTELEAFVEAYRTRRDLLRLHYHRPRQLLSRLQDMQLEQRSFPTPQDDRPQQQRFISMDEIDNVLRHISYQSDFRLKAYAFFQKHEDTKERAAWLRGIHGEMYGRFGGNDALEFTSRGISFSHGSITQPYAKLEWNWNRAAKRIDTLIRQGRFLTEEDRETLAHRAELHGESPQEEPVETAFEMEHGEELPDEPEEAETAETPEPEQSAPQEPTEAEPPAETETPAEPDAAKPPALRPPHRPRREQVSFTPLHPEIPARNRRNFHITDMDLGTGTPTEKYSRNVEAIRTLKRIEEEDRLATGEEQEILSRYVGWGGLADCFDPSHRSYEELKDLLTEEEYAAARASALTAFYTPPVVIQAVYQALGQMGFQRGNLLEPSCGVGNFIGMLPESMSESKVYGVELDSVSGRIARQLYQNSAIAVSGYERVEVPDSFFDVALGNVPFGDFKVLDRRYDRHHWLIHDYFFGKTLDKVRPGGVVAFLTSKGTMDKENSAVRRYLAQRADLIGAIRLPDNTFKRNAGTEVTSDIIFLQKRDRMTDQMPEWVELDTDGNGIRMNRYFVRHPEMVLGNMVQESGRFGMETACKAYEDADLGELLREAVTNLHAEITAYEVEQTEEEDRSLPADPTVRNFSYAVIDGKLYFRENARMNPVEVSVTAQNRIRGMIGLRDCVRQLIALQSEDYPEEDIRREQTRLNSLYDAYTAKYSLLNSRGNAMAFGEDSSYSLLCSLEVLDEEGRFLRKADMFTKRTIRPHVPVTCVDTASEALAISISEKARVDMGYMSTLTGKDEAELERELTGVIFRDVKCSEDPSQIVGEQADLNRFPLVTADEYLSGNVRKKLRMARAMMQAVPEEQRRRAAGNVSALEAVQPVDLTAGEIGVRIGVNWVPVQVYEQFMYDTFGTSYYARSRIHILRSAATGEWNITNKTADSGNVRTFTTYGTKRMDAYHILELTLNQKDVRVFDRIIDPDGREQRVLNKKETAIAQDRQEALKARFSEWVWQDIDRRERLCGIYNEVFNSIRPRTYDGQHITFPGMNPEIQLRKHQIDAIAHVMYGGNTLLAHEVGAGKTFEMVAAAMESKRLGLCTKSLVVVPNHITEQWAGEWLQLYPSANILVATKKDFERKNRRRFCARIATGDYDAIIIGHSQFEKIPMSKERQEIILQKQIDQILEGIEDAKRARAERYTVKQLERTKKGLEVRLAKLNDQSRKDDVVTFEELGVDRLFIDESHFFKNRAKRCA